MSTNALAIPEPRVPIRVRTATLDDLPFIDRLQKMHSHMVGFWPKKQLQANIKGENVVIAEGEKDTGGTPMPLGYCIFKDQYLKRDDVGIIYQLNVMPVSQGNLIGATLVKAVFERAAYGCKLFCCWCAQDIRANFFWEAIGFVPLAFRTGSRGKQRIHIFWQKRIDQEVRNTGGTPVPPTPYWFPYQTQAGAVREDRIVLPIPPDVHWRDVMPMVLPEMEPPEVETEEHKRDACATESLPGGAAVRPRPAQPQLTREQKAALKRSQSRHLSGVPLGKKAVISGGKIKYVERDDYIPEADAPDEVLAEQAEKQAKKKSRSKSRAPGKKNNPQLVAKARELRDKYLEQVNAGLILPAAWGEGGKYDVSRARLLGSDESIRARPDPRNEDRLLDAA